MGLTQLLSSRQRTRPVSRYLHAKYHVATTCRVGNAAALPRRWAQKVSSSCTHQPLAAFSIVLHLRVSARCHISAWR